MTLRPMQLLARYSVKSAMALQLKQQGQREVWCQAEAGAGDGNRTHGTSLGSWGITIIRHPQWRLRY